MRTLGASCDGEQVRGRRRVQRLYVGHYNVHSRAYIPIKVTRISASRKTMWFCAQDEEKRSRIEISDQSERRDGERATYKLQQDRTVTSTRSTSTASIRGSQAAIHCAKPTCVIAKVAGVAVSLPQGDHEDVCALLLLSQADRHRSPCQGAHVCPRTGCENDMGGIGFIAAQETLTVPPSRSALNDSHAPLTLRGEPRDPQKSCEQAADGSICECFLISSVLGL